MRQAVYASQAKSSSLADFISKVVLEQSRAHLFVYRPRLLSTTAQLSGLTHFLVLHKTRLPTLRYDMADQDSQRLACTEASVSPHSNTPVIFVVLT